MTDHSYTFGVVHHIDYDLLEVVIDRSKAIILHYRCNDTEFSDAYYEFNSLHIDGFYRTADGNSLSSLNRKVEAINDIEQIKCRFEDYRIGDFGDYSRMPWEGRLIILSFETEEDCTYFNLKYPLTKHTLPRSNKGISYA